MNLDRLAQTNPSTTQNTTLTVLTRFKQILLTKEPFQIASNFPRSEVLRSPAFPHKRTIVHELILSGDPFALYLFFHLSKSQEKPDNLIIAPLVNIQDEFGLTAVALAAWSAFEDGVRILVSLGADLFIHDSKHKFHALHWLVIAKANLPILGEIVKEGKYVETDKDPVNGHTLIEVALLGKKNLVVKYLLKNNCVMGDHALIYAIQTKADSLFDLFMEKKPNVDFQDAEGMTALHHAAVMGEDIGKHATVKLLAAGANPNLLTSSHGWNPLLFATVSKKPNLEVIQALIDAKTDLKAQEKKNGTTALMMSLSAPDDVFKLQTRFKTPELLKIKDMFGNDVAKLAFLMSHPLANLLK